MTTVKKLISNSLAQFKGENPFSNDYYFKELGKLKFPNIEKGSIKVFHATLNFGINQNYLYADMYEQTEEFPVLHINNEVYMSLSRMEVESHFMPIHLAHGTVGVGGLGLGYYVQSILNKKEVKSVVVYEKNNDVIDYYLSNFGKHEKLTIVNRDVFSMKGMIYDFFYMDIYQRACDYKALDDMKVIKENNYIDNYHFWTIEAFAQAMINHVEHDELFSHSDIKDMILTYLPFLVLLEEYGAKLTNYLNGKDIFDTLNK